MTEMEDVDIMINENPNPPAMLGRTEVSGSGEDIK